MKQERVTNIPEELRKRFLLEVKEVSATLSKFKGQTLEEVAKELKGCNIDPDEGMFDLNFTTGAITILRQEDGEFWIGLTCEIWEDTEHHCYGVYSIADLDF